MNLDETEFMSAPFHPAKRIKNNGNHKLSFSGLMSLSQSFTIYLTVAEKLELKRV